MDNMQVQEKAIKYDILVNLILNSTKTGYSDLTKLRISEDDAILGFIKASEPTDYKYRLQELQIVEERKEEDF